MIKTRLDACCLFAAFSFFLSAVSAQDYSLNENDFDRETRIQDDLFEHVNGTWLRTTRIPADKSNYGSFGKLADLSQLRVKELISSVAQQQNADGTDAQKVADFYLSFMNEEQINRLGAEPLQAELGSIGNIASKAELVVYFGRLSKLGVKSPVGFYVGQDAGEATQYITQITQSGTSLPDRDYYLKDEQVHKDARIKLVQYIERLFDLAGLQKQKELAPAILKLETSLAKSKWPRVKLRNAKLRYNKLKFADLQALTGDTVDWENYFEAVDLQATPDEIIVHTPSFFTDLAQTIDSVDLNTWKAYAQFRYIDAFASELSQPFVDAHFELYQRQLSGVEEQKPRWKRAVNLLSASLGEVVGKLYVEKHFAPESKVAMEALVDNLLAAFGNSIDNLTWMTDATKVKAKEKLSKITTKIGYPNEWRDYSKLKIDADDLFGNVVRTNLYEHDRNVSRLGQPIDREEWGMTPQTVNAYYNPTKNEIVFPAAILQAPFFDLNAPEPLNYGGIGAVIGHEISHAFDDQGSQYDGDGNLNNWWSEEDRESFQALTTALVNQFSEFEPLNGKRVDGKLTLGENIADLSGLEIAHRALTLARQGKPEVSVAGWNSDQLFFVGWSRVWQRKYKDQEMIKRLLTDPHSPSRYRTNGPVANIEAFYKAFDVQPGDKLYKPKSERIKIW